MNDVVRKLAGLHRQGRLPHGLLLLGADPDATKGHLLDLASALLCPEGGCGSCSACRRIRAGNHPDFLPVRTDGKEVRIEPVRELQRWLNLRPYEGAVKIGGIEEADLLNASASNALLKTLEEPPAHALVNLTARSIANLLPTVRSRLMPVRFPAPADESRFEANRPPWGDELEALLSLATPVPPDRLFDLTEAIAKDRDNLPWFFWKTQRTLRERIPEDRRLERVFDLSVAAERDVLRRYGNVPLALDRFLSEWLL